MNFDNNSPRVEILIEFHGLNFHCSWYIEGKSGVNWHIVYSISSYYHSSNEISIYLRVT